MKRPTDSPADRGDNLKERWYRNCQVCPHRCGTDDGIYVASAQLHFGEERVLVGRGGWTPVISRTSCGG